MRLPTPIGTLRKPDFVVDKRGRVRTAATVKTGIVKAGIAKAGAVVACGALLMTGTVREAGEQALAVAQTARANVVDLIERRSPGLRRWVSLSDSKKGVRARPVYRPTPRPRPIATAPRRFEVLAPPPPAVPIRFDTAEIAAGPITLAGIVPNLPPLEEGCLCQWAYVPPTNLGGGLVIGIGGGGAGGTLPGPPTVRPPAVPEAETWAMMIMGFAIMGTLWRRRRIIVRMIGSTLVLRLNYAPAIAQSGR